ncbi:MAG: thioredoxin-dependent thiol peroxidase [Bacteroidota bacterium]
MLNIGEKAPSFSGVDQNNNTLEISQFKGSKIVLYFYPKDSTPGCTAEACNLRDNYELLQKEGFKIIGVSPDNVKSHEKFATKYELPFPLIADTDKKIVTDYQVWGEKKFMGRTYMGVFRTTFIINEQGIIEDILTQVDTKNHTEQIINQQK